jgi:hypothetical protein
MTTKVRMAEVINVAIFRYKIGFFDFLKIKIKRIFKTQVMMPESPVPVKKYSI